MKKILSLFLVTITILSSIGCNIANNIKERTNESSTTSEKDISPKNKDEQSKSNNDKKKASDNSADTTTYSTEISSKLGDDIFNKSFQIDDIVYTLPATVNDFIDNGWTITDQEEYSEILPPNFPNTIVLKKNRSFIYLFVENQTNEKRVSSECPVTGIQRVDRTLLILPRNIGIGSLKEDVDKAYADIDKKVTQKYETIFYTFYKDKYQIVISVDTEINRVYAISLALTKF